MDLICALGSSFDLLHLLTFISMYDGHVRKGRKGATVFEWLNCPICQREQPVLILSNDFPQGNILRILQPPTLE